MSLKGQIVDRFEGFWWKPENPEIKFRGTLTKYESGRLDLAILSNRDDPNISNSARYKPGNLAGLAKSESTGKDSSFFLYDLLHFGENSSYLNLSKYYVTYALFSIPTMEVPTEFASLRFGSKKLSDWVRVTGFQSELTDFSENKFIAKVNYSRPDTISLYHGEKIGLDISFHPSKNWLREERKESVRESVYLNFKMLSFGVNDIFKWTKWVERFMMIIWEGTNPFTLISVKSVEGNSFELWSAREQTTRSFGKEMKYEDFLPDTQKIWDNWTRVSNQFDVSIRSFFFAYTDHKVDIYNRFLNFIFALEQLHRTGFKSTVPRGKANVRMYKKALEEVKADTKSWLKKQLTEERDVPIKERLVELIEYAEYEQLLIEEVKRVVSTRHYLVHLDIVHKGDAYEARDLVDVNDKLCFLFFRVLKKMMIEEKEYPRMRAITTT